MFPQMSIQIGLLTKGPLAERAAEGLLFVMNISNVALQIGGNWKGPFTKLAAVGLFARVRSQVTGQVGRSRKHLDNFKNLGYL